MPEMNDMALICEYAERNSESAFADLVHRHIHLVYSVAFRYLGNSADAQDVTQAVFVILARKAASLRRRSILTGWLYETTRFTAATFLRSKARQQTREQEAYMQSTSNDPDANGVWRQIAPVLEDAMNSLDKGERELLALRYFENRTAAETAAVLGIREAAAYKRAARALDKVRRFFLKRGIHSTTATISGAISANSVQAAPSALAKSVTAIAMKNSIAASASTSTLIKGTLKLMAWTKLKTTIAAGAIVLLAVGTATVSIQHARAKGESGGFSFVGYATPEASAESTIWAASRGDFKGCLAGCTPKHIEYLQNKTAGKSDEEISQWVKVWANALKDYKITQKEVISDGEVHLHIYTTPSEGIRNGKVTVVMKKVGNEWKQEGDL